MSKRVEIQIDAIDKASESLAHIKAKIKEVVSMTAEVTSRADISQATQALDKIEAMIQDLQDEIVEIPVTADTTQAEGSLSKIKQMYTDFKKGGVGGIVGGFIGGAMGSVVTEVVQGVGQAIGKVMNAGKEAFIDYNSMLEQTEVAFTSMLGSASKAKAVMEDLRKFSAETPFEFKDVAPAAQQLKAFGFTAKELIPTLTAAGNAAAGLGKGTEGLKQITYVLGQIRSTGKLMGQDVMQLSAMGVPVKDILAKNLGLTADQLANIGEQGIDAKTAIDAIINGMNERFPDMMKKQANTFAGIMSTIRDDISQIFGKMGEGIFGTIKEIASRVKNVVDTMLKNVKENGFTHIFDGLINEEWSRVFINIFETIGMVVDRVKVLFMSFIDVLSWVADSSQETGGVVGELSEVFKMVANVITGFQTIIISVFLDISRFSLWLVKVIKKTVGEAITFILGKLNKGVSGLNEFFVKASSVVRGWLSALGTYIVDWVSSILDRFGSLGKGIKSLAKMVGKEISDFWDNSATKRAIDVVFHPPTSIGGSGEEKEETTGGNVGDTSAGSALSGASSRALDAIENAIKRIADLTKDFTGKILSEIGTTYEIEMEKLSKTLSDTQAEIKKAMELGIDTTALQEKLAKYESIVKEKLLRRIQEANEDIINETRKASAQLLGDKAKEADIVYEMELAKLRRQKEVKLKEIALTMESAEAKLTVERWFDAQVALLEKKRNESKGKVIRNYSEAWKATLESVYERLKDKGEQLKELSDNIFGSITDTIQTTFTDALTGNFNDIGKAFSDMLKNMLRSIAKFLANQLVHKLTQRLFSPQENTVSSGASFGGLGVSSLLGGSISNWLLGRRATGGPVSSAKAYLVGERGPEIFRPTSNGRIDNHIGSMGSTQAPNIKVIVNNNGNQNMDVKTKTEFDGASWVTSIVLDAISTNKDGMRDVIKGVV